MKIAIFETEQWEREACLRLAPAHLLVCTGETLTEGTATRYADAEALSPFVYSRLTSDVLAHFPKLRLIATRSTGVDHIDMAYCHDRGVTVCNVPAYGDSTVAEHVFALLLGLARHLPQAVERTRRGQFDQTGLRGFELKAKTMAVIGAGRIGMRVVEIARGFGMNVIAVDERRNTDAARRLDFQYASLEQALAVSDVITLHVPATPETANLIGEREFGLMKHGAILINTARGSVVDVGAMVRALADHRLSAAGLDVLPQEPQLRDEAEIFRSGAAESRHDYRALVANHVLLQFPNVLVTPHIAYDTDEAVGRIIETTIENIEAFARGAPQNVVP